MLGTAKDSFVLDFVTQERCKLLAGLNLGLLIDKQVCSLHVQTVVSAVVSAIKLVVRSLFTKVCVAVLGSKLYRLSISNHLCMSKPCFLVLY